MKLSFDLEHPLYLEALTHSSYTKEHPEAGNHNEVLEFIGDSVLQLCMTDVLVDLYPNHREGDLTRMRHHLVDTKTLASIAREIGLGSLIRMGKGEERDGGRNKDRMLANTVEAILGALYRLRGLTACQAVVEHHFRERALQIEGFIPPKQRLLEWCQRTHGTTPEYKLIKSEGPPHMLEFTIGVWIAGKQLASGVGPRKKDATVAAAVAAVKRLRQEGAMTSDIG